MSLSPIWRFPGEPLIILSLTLIPVTPGLFRSLLHSATLPTEHLILLPINDVLPRTQYSDNHRSTAALSAPTSPCGGYRRISTSNLKENQTSPQGLTETVVLHHRGQDFHIQTKRNRSTPFHPDLRTMARIISKDSTSPGSDWLAIKIEYQIVFTMVSVRSTHTEGSHLYKLRGVFLSITKVLSDGRSYTLWVPRGRQASGWYFSRSSCPQPKPQDREANQQLLQGLPPHKLPPRLYQQPLPTPAQWPKPTEAFRWTKQDIKDASENCGPDSATAIFVDSSKLPHNIEKYQGP